MTASTPDEPSTGDARPDTPGDTNADGVTNDSVTDDSVTDEAAPHVVPPVSERTVSSAGIMLPPDLREGPVVVGVDDVSACGRPLRAAVFLARALERPVLAVHVRRRAVPLVEGYVPIPEEVELDDNAEEELERQLSADLASSGEMADVSWELISTSGDAAAELIRIADERSSACLVVGKRHRGFGQFLHRMASGSVSRAVISSQKFPVMVVP